MVKYKNDCFTSFYNWCSVVNWFILASILLLANSLFRYRAYYLVRVEAEMSDKFLGPHPNSHLETSLFFVVPSSCSSFFGNLNIPQLWRAFWSCFMCRHIFLNIWTCINVGSNWFNFSLVLPLLASTKLRDIDFWWYCLTSTWTAW